MNIQVLVATMNQIDHSLLDALNIQSDAIVGNQCNRNAIENFKYKFFNVTYLNFREAGVGLNRNNSLMRASGDVCLLADDDMTFFDNYPAIVSKAFEERPDADVLIFNVIGADSGKLKVITPQKINCLNYMRYGAVRLAFRLNSIRLNGVFFNLCFGGGAEYCHGEDTLFLTECIKRGLKIYAVPEYVGKLDGNRESTWFKGYDEKYLRDQGALYKAISKTYWRLLCLQDAVRKYKVYRRSWYSAYELMVSGGNCFG